jgi:hypothetical protein
MGQKIIVGVLLNGVVALVRSGPKGNGVKSTLHVLPVSQVEWAQSHFAVL